MEISENLDYWIFFFIVWDPGIRNRYSRERNTRNTDSKSCFVFFPKRPNGVFFLSIFEITVEVFWVIFVIR